MSSATRIWTRPEARGGEQSTSDCFGTGARRWHEPSAWAVSPSSPSIAPWMSFIEAPSARRWYRAHNGTVVAAYLDHRGLAEAESRPERFFLNVALLRVLYVHALVAAPRLALGRLGAVGPVVGDPRLGGVGAYLSMGRVLPDRYPLDADLETYLIDEHDLGRLIDYGVYRTADAGAVRLVGTGARPPRAARARTRRCPGLRVVAGGPRLLDPQP